MCSSDLMNPIEPPRGLLEACLTERALRLARREGNLSRRTGAAHATPRGRHAPDAETAADMAPRAVPSRRKAHRGALDSDPSLTSQQLQVLFHSLSKVLFIFRSRYLFAIGLPMIFSLGRGIPAVRTAFPSSTTPQTPGGAIPPTRTRGYHPLWRSFPGRLWCVRFRPGVLATPQLGLPRFGLGCSRFARRY